MSFGKVFGFDSAECTSAPWPRGGGFFIFDSVTGEFSDNNSRPEILPSAKAAIMLQDEDIAVFECEGETEAEVKAKVEAWASEAFRRIEQAIRREFAQSQPNGPQA
jgi:hypothetical protein